MRRTWRNHLVEVSVVTFPPMWKLLGRLRPSSVGEEGCDGT